MSGRDELKRNNIWACECGAGPPEPDRHRADPIESTPNPTVLANDNHANPLGNAMLRNLLARRSLSARVLGAVALTALLVTALPAEAQVDARMLRFPDVSSTHISFVYAGDIWIAPKEGGVARRLSTPSGEEQFPRFSPDGQSIAYSANYDGNVDVYVVPTFGGLVQRVTHHPMGDRMLDWTPDGASILYASGMTSEKNRFSKLFTVPVGGGLPTQLPVPYGEFGTISPDGNTLAYMPISRDFRTWKRYRGGMAPEIWLFDLNDNSARNITNSDANDGQPMFHGSTL